MGSPISNTIAQLIREDLGEQVITELDFKPNFLKDMWMTAWLVAQMTKLQFTLENEQNNMINFLDLMLIREKTKILTKLYCKPTSSGRYLNFHSTQPFASID